jgi:hypothetical protein
MIFLFGKVCSRIRRETFLDRIDYTPPQPPAGRRKKKGRRRRWKKKKRSAGKRS